MNANFLKKVFSSNLFVHDYIFFLGFFRSLAHEDNDKKICYLSSLVNDYLQISSLQVTKYYRNCKI